MNEPATLVERVRRVLMADWDPIGVRNVSQVGDEYDGYARQIAGQLVAGTSLADLSNGLLEIEISAMGLPGNRDRANAAARKLWQIANHQLRQR
jgi:hypothetical protein